MGRLRLCQPPCNPSCIQDFLSCLSTPAITSFLALFNHAQLCRVFTVPELKSYAFKLRTRHSAFLKRKEEKVREDGHLTWQPTLNALENAYVFAFTLCSHKMIQFTLQKVLGKERATVYFPHVFDTEAEEPSSALTLH